uniref:Protein TIFY n=1 Tax=Manihot esculenta TaxID=3983 RepID=A0A2C9VJF7_MANES
MDFLVKKEQPIGLEDENDNDPLVMASCLDFKVAALKKKKKQKKMCFDHHELTDDRSSQILSMFRKYLYSKTQNDVVGKTNMEESEAIKLKHAARFTPRQASLLEQKLLRGIRKEEKQSEFDGKSSAAQLTIFYAGTINVYNNVPAHKAQAIMLLAGESSTSKPASVELPAKMETNGISSSVNLTSVCKLQAVILYHDGNLKSCYYVRRSTLRFALSCYFHWL